MFDMKILGGVRGSATSAPVQEESKRTQQTESRTRKGVDIFKRFAKYFCYSATPAKIESMPHSVLGITTDKNHVLICTISKK